MNKLISASLIAILTVGVANAAPEYAAAVPVEPLSVTANTKVASTSYVQGAYNEAIKAVNKENQRALAAEGDLTTLATDTKTSLVGAINEIASGAAAGATALQSGDNVSELTNDAGYITNAALSGLATETYVNTAISTASSDYATAAQGATAEAVNTLVGNVAMGTTAETVTGAIKELKDASDATNNKVLKVYTTWNTDTNQEVTLTAPTPAQPQG